MLILLAGSVFTACNKDNALASDEVENYIDSVVFDRQNQGN